VALAGRDRERLYQREEVAMNWDRIEGNWKQLKGKAREKWGKLTDDDIDVVAGKREQLVGTVQERYGIARDEAEKQVDEFQRALSVKSREAS
jgi:uncharacterized protein YjbJ (UPF0337 family)